MTSACPCGCGRSVGFVERCLAKRAVYIGSLMIVAERMRDKTDRADQWTTFVRSRRDKHSSRSVASMPLIGDASMPHTGDASSRRLPTTAT